MTNGTKRTLATAFAPATVANVAVGFDILGFAVEGVGDTVTVKFQEGRDVTVVGSSDFPLDPEKNTATAGLVQLIHDRSLTHGFHVTIKKGIPPSSGMGGSAASAVAGILAANELLDQKLSRDELLRYALVGEAVASGAVHADNVAPCLLGGLVLVKSALPPDLISLPSPGLCCVLVHPDLKVSTKEARQILKPEIALKTHVIQSSHLAGFLAACFNGDLKLLARSFEDVVIEPQRSQLITGIKTVKEAALRTGALGCSISGSGPSVFAWVKKEYSDAVAAAMVAGFRDSGVAKVESWISPMPARGARIVD
jgi:homoserine kinase